MNLSAKKRKMSDVVTGAVEGEMRNLAKNLGIAVAGAMLLAVTALGANASVVITTDTALSGGSFAVTDNNMYTFDPPFGAGIFETLDIDTTFTLAGPMEHSVTVPNATDCHAPPFDGCGIRWVQTVTNNTGVDWTEYHINLTGSTALLWKQGK